MTDVISPSSPPARAKFVSHTGLRGTAKLIFTRDCNWGDNRPMTDETDALRAQLAAQTQQLIALSFDKAIGDGRCMPAARATFAKQFKGGGTLEDAAEWIANAPRPPHRSPASLPPRDGADPLPLGDGLPDTELCARAIKLCRDRGTDPRDWFALAEAGREIMRANPALAQRYVNLPDDHAAGHYT